MKVLKAVKERRSVRNFLPKEIPGSLIDYLVEALVWAPSAGNLQSRRFIFILNQETRERIALAALNQRFIAEAPLTVVACTDSRIRRHYGERGVNLYAIQDVSASIMGMMLVAHEAGLGSVWVGAFHEDEVSRVLNLGEELTPVAIVPVGYPEKNPPPPPPRISASDAVRVVH
jgi:nitroreductase